MAVKSYFEFFKAYVKLNLATAMEYRLNFIVSSTFMIINDILFMLFWYFLFGKVGDLYGWQFKDVLLLIGIVALVYGLVGFFFGNLRLIYQKIAQGEFDFYLSLPKNELFHVLISRSSFSALGDVFFGIVVFFLVVPITPYTVTMFMFTVVCAVLITLFINIIFQSLSFYFGNAEGMAHVGETFTVGISTYPHVVFDGFARMFIFVIMPVAFISNVPVMLIQSFDLKWFFLLIVVTFLVVIVSLFIYKQGLKRYESGNLVNIRV